MQTLLDIWALFISHEKEDQAWDQRGHFYAWIQDPCNCLLETYSKHAAPWLSSLEDAGSTQAAAFWSKSAHEDSAIGDRIIPATQTLTTERRGESGILYGWACLSVVLHHQLCRRFEPHPGRPPGKSAEPEQGTTWGIARPRTLRPRANITVAITEAFPSSFIGEEDNFYFLFVCFCTS